MKKLKYVFTLFLALSLMISFVCFVSFAADGSSASKSGNNLFIHILIALAIGFLVAFIVTAVMRSKLKSVRPNNAAANYTREGSFNVTESREIFLYEETTKTKIQKEEENNN